MNSVTCPECGATIEVAGDLVYGEVLSCGDCGSELEVTSVEPIQVALAPEVEEDWGE